MFTENINFKNFKIIDKTLKIKQKFISILNNKNPVITSLSEEYKDSYSKTFVNKYKNLSNFRVIGMGGSTLGTQAIYDFLNDKIKKNFIFIDNLQANVKKNVHRNLTNLIISKSGNTIETIANANINIKKKDKN